MSKAFWILLLLLSFLVGMITEAYLDTPEPVKKPVIQKQWEPPKTPFPGLQRV